MDVISTMQAAQELNLSYMSVLRLVQTGALDAYRKTNAPRSHLMIYRASLERFKARQRQGRPTAEVSPPATA